MIQHCRGILRRSGVSLMILIVCGTVVKGEPVFQINFEQGLAPVGHPGTAGRWTGEKPPQYYEHGIQGPALIVGDVDGTGKSPSIRFDRLPGTDTNGSITSGTMLFWIRGLRNWDLYRTVYHEPPGISQYIAGGGGTIWKHTHDTGGIKIAAGSPQVGDYRQIFFSRFNHYRWTQIGYSWQGDHLRIYLNGDLVNENTQFPINFTHFYLGGGNAYKDSRILYDNLKIWDRALTVSEIKRIYRRDFQLATRPVVTAAYLPEGPVIDGSIEPGEWGRASRITGMLEAERGERATDQSAFYIGYDSEYLYIAMRGDMTETARVSPALVMETFLKAEGDLESDDAVEIIIVPGYFASGNKELGYWDEEERFFIANVETEQGDTFFQTESLGNWDEYRFLSNAGDERQEAVYGSDGTDRIWSSGWETASTVSNQFWQFEARVPLASFGQTPVAGEIWGIQFSRLWRHLKQEDNCWAWGFRQVNGVEQGTYVGDEYGSSRAFMGMLAFGQPDGVTVRVNRTGQLEAHSIDWQADITNNSLESREIEVRLFTDTGRESFDRAFKGSYELYHSETFSIGAGDTLNFEKLHRISDFNTSVVNFEVYGTEGALIHRTSVPFYLREEFGVHVRRFPNYERFFLDLDLGTLSHVSGGDLNVDIDFEDLEGNPVFSCETVGISGYRDSIEYSTEKLSPGDYRMIVSIRRGTEDVAVREIEYKKAGKAEWYGNRHGFEDMDTDVVPYPWTDMTVEDNTVGVWGRNYIFGNAILPEQVTTLGKSLLRAPMRIIMELRDGERIELSGGEIESELKKHNRTRVEGIKSVVKEEVRFSNNFWAEYDGYVWNSMEIEPGKKIEVSSLFIEIPLTKEFTDVDYRGWYGNGDGGIQVFGGVRREVEGYPDIDRSNWWSLSWFAERSQSETSVEGGTVRIFIIDEPVTIEGLYNFDISFIATPVRPKTWRTPEYHPHSRKGLGGAGPWYPEGLYFMPAADIGSNYYNLHGRIYVHTNPVSRGEKDALGSYNFDNYVYEWLSNQSERVLSTHEWVHPTLKSKSYRDYFVWRHWRYQKKYGFAGLYFDNPLQDDLLGTRELIKRLYNITLSNQYFSAREQAVTMAVNGNMNMSFQGFTTYQYDGEHLNGVIQHWKTYIGNITPESHRRLHMGHNLGLGGVSFPGQARMRDEWVQAAGGPEAVADHMQGLELLHDNYPSGWHMKGVRNQACKRASDAVKRHRWDHWMYQYTPYWEQDIVKLPREDMYASLYIARPSRLTATDPLEYHSRMATFRSYFNMYKHLPLHIQARIPEYIEQERGFLEHLNDKAIIIVYNHSDWEGEMRIALDWAKLGLGGPDELSAENAVHSTGFRVETESDAEGNQVEKGVFFERPEEYARIEGGELVFPMTRYNYRMIVIVRKR